MAEGDAILNFEDFINFGDGFDQAIADIRLLKKELQDLAKDMKRTYDALSPSDTKGIASLEKELKKLEVTKKNLAKQEKVIQDSKKKSIDLTNEELIKIQESKIAQRERIALAKQQAIINKSAAGSIEELRARLSKNTLEWKKLSAAERENSSRGKDLVKTKLLLTNQLKKLEKQTGDTRRNVGNYSDSLGKLGKVAARVFLGRSLVDGLRRIGTAFTSLIEKNKATDSSISALDKAIGQFSKSSGGLGLAILKLVAGPLTAFLNGAKRFIDFLSGASGETDKFSATSEALGGTIDKLNQDFNKEQAALSQVFFQLSQANEGSEERKDIIDQINTQYGKYLPNLLTEKSTLEEVAQAQDLVNQALTTSFLLRVQQATQIDIFNKKSRETIAAFNEIKDASGGAIGADALNAFQKLTTSLSKNAEVAAIVVERLQGIGGTSDDAKGIIRGLGSDVSELVTDLVALQRGGDNVLGVLQPLVRNTLAYDRAIQDTNASIGGLNEGLKTYDRTLEKNTATTNANTDAQKKAIQARIDAINALQRQLAEAEANNIQDREARALRLEELRFEAENALRIKNFKELEILLEGQEEELRQAQLANYRLSEEQLIAHEANKLKIRKDNAIQTIEIEAIDVTQQGEPAIAELLNEEVRLVEEANDKKKKSNDELLKSVSDNAQKVSKIITDLFEKQADLSKAAVDEQSENLAAARERAAQGLETNLAFEEKELAKRQAEAQRKQKEAEQAQKLATLFSLVAAYAQSGDENALSRALVDFAFLTAFSAGFEEGGYTGDIGQKQIAGVVHGNEFVVTAKDTARFGLKGKKGDEFGEAMSDYYTPQTATLTNPYEKQKEAFAKGVQKSDTNSKEVVQAIDNLSRQIKSQPNTDYKIKKAMEQMYYIITEENKANMKKISKEILRARK